MSQAPNEIGEETEVEVGTETGIVHPITSPLSFWRWVKALVVHPAIASAYARNRVDTPPPVDPDHIFAGTFIYTFPMDGYVPSTTHITATDGNEGFLRDERISADEGELSVLAALLIFLGLPSRASMKDDNRQVIRNFFGDWDSLWPASTRYRFSISGKRFWNIFVSPVKVFIILPLKIVGVFFKLALNIVKLVTEFLPELIVNYTAKEIGSVLRTLNDKRRKAGRIFKHDIRRKRNPQEKIDYPWGEMIGMHVVGILWLAILLPLHYAARLVGFVGEAITSPEKSARDAWEFGARVRPRALGYVLGTLGAAFSLALTTTLWMIILPFAVSGILTLFPQLTPVLAAIAQWPVVASSLNFIQGTFTLVAGSLPAVFSSIATAMSAAVGISVSNLVLAVTITVAVIAAPVLTIGSRIADELSNGWARWQADMGFAQGMKAIFTPKSANVQIESVEMYGTPLSGEALEVYNKGVNTESQPAESQAARRLVGDSQALLQKSQSHVDRVGQSKAYRVTRFEKLEKGYKAIEVDTTPVQYV